MGNSKLFITLLIVIVILFVWLGFLKSSKVETKNNELQAEELSQDETKVLLYFLDNTYEKFVSEYRNVSIKDIKENMINTILEELIKGPVSNEFKSIIPKETKIKSVSQEGGKITVDFSKEFLSENDSEEDKIKKIYSVVNTLTEVKEIEEVEIKVEGTKIALERRV